MNRKLKKYTIAISLLSVILFYAFIPTIPHFSEIWLTLIFFIFISIIAEIFPVSLPAGGQITITFPIDFVVILVHGPGMAMIVSAFSVLGILLGKDDDKQLGKIIFNAAQFSIASGVAGSVYNYMGGALGKVNYFNYVFPAILCALTYCIINSILVTIGISLNTNINITKVYKVNIKEVLPSYLAEAPLGFIMAIVYVQVGMLGILLFFFPLILARRSFELYTKMRKMYLDTIKTLAATIDAKDPYTHGHSDRVSKMAVQLARKLGYMDSEVEYLEYAAIFHDIGKIGIEDRILGKKDKLNDEEYEKIKQHPIIGAGIIESIEFLKKCSKTVLYHHERYDGKGYPEGLKGEEIPRLSRVLAIVDSYDAMNSDRPYRKKLKRSEILIELKKGSGTQFDPKIVPEFILLMEKNEEN